jgi:NADH-quinone oxidoreductase subunit C
MNKDHLPIFKALFETHCPNAIVAEDVKGLMPSLTIAADKLVEVCSFLHENEDCYFDLLSCLTGIDNGESVGTMEVVYQLYSIPYEHSLTLRVVVDRQHPVIDTVSHIWRTADWHEREAYDLLGIHFTNHPDLRRILLPEDWEGFPLRKDYKPQETYHGIKVD